MFFNKKRKILGHRGNEILTTSNTGGGIASITSTGSTLTINNTDPDNPNVEINLANSNFWTALQTLGNGMVARNAVQDTTVSTGIFSRLSSTAQVRIGHTSSWSGIRIDNPVGSIARFTSAQGGCQFGTDTGNGNSSSIIQSGVERFRITGGTFENMSTGTLTGSQVGFTRTSNDYIRNTVTGGSHQFNVNNVTALTVQSNQVLSPRYVATGFSSAVTNASFRGSAGNTSSFYYPGGTMSQNLAQVFTPDTSETTLLTRSVLAQEINRNEGQGVIMKAFGRFNNPTVATRLRVRFDGIEIFNSGDLNGIVGTDTWLIESTVNRTTANNIIVCTRLLIDGLPAIVQTDDFSVTMTGAVDFNLTAESDDSEVRKDWGKYYYDPMA
jgi:hypothetical protein